MGDQLAALSVVDAITRTLGTSSFHSLFTIYQCRICDQILAVTKGPLAERPMGELRDDRCPACALPLAETLTSRSLRAPFDTPFWKHPQIHLKAPSEPRPRVRFDPATSLFGLSSQIGVVDHLLGGLGPETIALLKGPRLPLLAAERYCVRAQLAEHLGGSEGRALFIDGGNSFDVYLFTAVAREYGLDLDRALSRLIISRAFTPYELLQLVSRDAEEVFEAYHPQLLVISDVFSLFTQDVEEDEARRIMGRIGRSIRSISQRRRIPIVLTGTRRAEYLEFLFQEYCNVEAEFSEGSHQIRARLLKHPSKEPSERVQEVGDQPYNQRLLTPLQVRPYG